MMFSGHRTPFTTLMGMAVAAAAAAWGAEPQPGDGAAAPWDAAPFSAEPEAVLAAAAARPAPEDADVEILFRQGTWRFAADGSRTLERHLLYRVLSERAVEGWSKVTPSWRPWHQERPELRARVIAPGGAEHLLDPSTVAESGVGEEQENMLSDRMQLLAPLPAVAVGAIVEERVVYRDTAPLFAAGVRETFQFGLGVPVRFSRLVLDAPESLPLRWVARNLAGVEPEVTAAGGRVRLVFEVADPAVPDDVEPMMPGDVVVASRVSFSTGASWAEVAGHYGGLVDAQIGEPGLASVVRKATRGARGRREKAERLLAWLQSEIRYTGLAFGEAAIVPRPPQETLARKYGDCKDKATLLVALLRTAGIEAHLALLSTGPGMDVEPELPGLGDFDHAIVYAPGGREAEDLWIDPTDEFAAAGELPAGDQGRLALIARPGTPGLIPTPAAGPGDNFTVETREVFLAADLGAGRVVETTEARGALGRVYRGFCHGSDRGELGDYFESYVQSAYGAEKLGDWGHSDPEDLSGPFEIRLEAVDAAVAATDQRHAGVAVNTEALFQSLPSFLLEGAGEADGDDGDDAGRRHDLVLSEPFVTEWRYRVVPPAGYQPADLPETEVRRFGPATYSRQVTADDAGMVRLDLRFDTGARRFTPAEVEELRAGVGEALAEDVLWVGFDQVGEAHLAAGDVRRALAEFDRLVARTPERALPHIRRSQALLAAGLGEAARAAAERAVELQPELDLVYQNLGWILQHDLIGRHFGPGFDHAAAVAAYRKALEVDPSNWNTRLALAIVLEHDAEGFRYASGSRLDEAIVEYLEVFEETVETGLEDNLPIALARAGRFDEMLEWTRKIPAAQSRDPLLLVALAATGGPAAAVREARKTLRSDQQQPALATAAQTLLQLRHYPQAAELFAAAARGAEQPAAVLAMAETVRKTRRYEEIEFTDDEPLGFVRRLMVVVLLADEEALRTMLSPRLSQEVVDAELAEMRREAPKLRRALRQMEVPHETVVDLTLSSLEATVDGDDEAGYRLHVRWNLGGVKQSQPFFVVRDDGGYRLLASDQLPSLGAEALRQLDAGHLDAARRWLDWARDQVPSPPAGDPFAGDAFGRLWTRDPEADAETIRVAAASLVAGGGEAESVLEVLEHGRERAATEERRWGVELALVEAFIQLDRREDVVAMAREWVTARPRSIAAFEVLTQALVALDRLEEVEAAAKARLAAAPDDAPAVRVLASLAQRRGDLDGEDSHLQRLLELDSDRSYAYNNLAWNAVVRGEVGDQALAWAQQAVSITGGMRPNSLHTLASVYAELDRPSEARQVLLQQMTVRGFDEPRSHDWYVLGRIAQSYGIRDAAISAYRRVEAPESDSAQSVYGIAQRRLAKLTAAPSR